MCKNIRHISNYGIAKLRSYIYICIGRKISFSQPNHKTTITAIFNVLEPYSQTVRLYFFPLLITQSVYRETNNR